MKTFFTYLAINAIVFLLTPQNNIAQCHIDDWTALKALFESADGVNWLSNSQWIVEMLGSAPTANCNLGNISGVTLNEDGRVEDLLISLFNGSIPPEIDKLSNLTKLRLSGSFSNSIPPEIGNLINLTSLRLSGNHSSSIPPEIGNLSSLTSLTLSGFIGSIPLELGNLGNLSFLSLSENRLSGSIPPELGNLSNLTYFDLSFNELSGDIPPELGNLSSLTNLDMVVNQLSGSIPPELGNLINLTSLNLAANQLSGSIPAELGNLINLTILDLDVNQLSGSIPPEIGNLSSLNEFEISDNLLSGCYSTNLNELCEQFVRSSYYYPYGYSYYVIYSGISEGNNFDASWEDFCTTDAGACSACASNISNLVIDNTTPLQNLFQANVSITTLGIVEINNGEQVEFKAPDITLNEGFSAKIGCNFTASYGNCQ